VVGAGKEEEDEVFIEEEEDSEVEEATAGHSMLKGAELCGELHSGIPELGLELGFDPKENGSGA